MNETARHSKKVLSRDSGDWLLCCWDTCEKPGYEANKAVQRVTENSERKTVTYVFCSERHKQYFLHSHIRYGFTA